VIAAEEALGETSEEEEAKESLCKLESELLQLNIDLQEKLTFLASLASTALLTREQYVSSMDMLGEVKDKLERYMDCAEEIKKGSETAAAEKIKRDAQTFYKTNSPSLSGLSCAFIMVRVEINSLDECSNTKTMPEKEFFAAESLCCEPLRRCQGCRGCQECGLGVANVSPKEYKELQVVEDSSWFDENIDKWGK
jgi:hypothetical protein